MVDVVWRWWTGRHHRDHGRGPACACGHGVVILIVIVLVVVDDRRVGCVVHDFC